VTRVLVLNELHPEEQPGAATIAFDFAQSLSRTSDVIFMHTSEICHNTDEGLVMRKVDRKLIRTTTGYSYELLKIAQDLFGLVQAWKYFKEIKKSSPKVIWIHQIGNFIPRILLLLLPSIAPITMTVHDYGLIIPRKLYPKDLSRKKLERLNVNFPTSRRKHIVSMSQFFKHFIYKTRRLLLRFYLRKVRIVCISQLQADIHRVYGYKVFSVISNGIERCDCENISGSRENKSVLFLGRTTGKGLDRLFESLSGSGINSYFAGGDDLREMVQSSAHMLNAEFLGKLNRTEIFKALHLTKLSYVASDCFDVYPTAGIEAIRHGAVPIVSDTTGLRDLVSRIGPEFVLDATQDTVPFEQYFRFIELNSHELQQKLSQINRDILTVDESLERYLSLLQRD
jgi:glycosyltransferase involved in cell wall biosynthesis